MIDRLNFFDIYAYLLPGVLLLGFVALPFATEYMPSAGVIHAVVGLPVAYVIGHVLYALTSAALPSGRLENGRLIHYSDDLLAPSNASDDIHARILQEFNIDLAEDASTEELLKRRGQAFRQCRDFLEHEGRGKHAQQMQGMYTFMRGATGACLLGATYYLGWLLGELAPQDYAESKWFSIPLGVAPLFVVFLGAAAAILPAWKPQHSNACFRCIFWCLAGVGAVTGFFFNAATVVEFTSRGVLTSTVATSLFVAGIAYARFQYFAKQYAQSILSGFLVATSRRTTEIVDENA